MPEKNIRVAKNGWIQEMLAEDSNRFLETNNPENLGSSKNEPELATTFLRV